MPRPIFFSSNSRGFTLVEAMVVVAVAAMLIGFSYTGFSRTLQRQRCQAAAQKIAWVLKQAQMQAVEKHTNYLVDVDDSNQTVKLTPDPDGSMTIRLDPYPQSRTDLDYRGVKIKNGGGGQVNFTSRGLPPRNFFGITFQLNTTKNPGEDGNVTVSKMGRVTIATPGNWQY